MILWDIGRIPKDKAPILSGILLLDRSRQLPAAAAGGGGGDASAAAASAYSKSKMIMDDALCVEASFRVVGVGLSGLSVDSLHLVNEAYKLYKGVRYTVKSGRMIIR